MNTAIQIAKLAALIALSVALAGIYQLAAQLRTETMVRTAATYAIVEEVSAFRVQLLAQVDRARQDLKNEIGATREAASSEIRATRREAREEIAASRQQIISEIRPVLQRTESLLASYEALPDRAAYANRWLWDCENYSGCLQSQVLALTGSARYTMGQIAKAAPDVAASVKATAESTALAAQASAATAQQVKELTKPGPKWLRWFGIGASVAVPTSQIALPFVVGKLQEGGTK